MYSALRKREPATETHIETRWLYKLFFSLLSVGVRHATFMISRFGHDGRYYICMVQPLCDRPARTGRQPTRKTTATLQRLSVPATAAGPQEQLTQELDLFGPGHVCTLENNLTDGMVWPTTPCLGTSDHEAMLLEVPFARLAGFGPGIRLACLCPCAG